jgi:hypothetical protein
MDSLDEVKERAFWHRLCWLTFVVELVIIGAICIRSQYF